MPPSIDVFLRDFLGADYQDYARLKLAILGAKQYATGQVKTQPEVVTRYLSYRGTNGGHKEETRKRP